ncbi:hypothetical protein NA57DRAFT_44997 [Rhizodiscina lignyota]|uniref:Uncharacterized protein n=1 Tax=Rhizodiscina lignyota TaxID=1504668 RepID=A0A9P4I7W6_9PEZI|nr:hypothetical protein NA57DRAFT_44997 [Rhizodiscina lignyota]
MQGPPYPLPMAGPGGTPTIGTDIPICAVFIFLYICFAITNMTIFQINRRRGHKFVLSALLFGFCMARIATLVLRIALATRQHNVRLAIAAQIFVNAGILIVYIVNLLLAQRILRAKQPHIGWNPVLRILYKILWFSIPAALAMVITTVVLTVYTLNTHTRMICRDVQLAAITYLLVFTTLPLFHVAAVLLLPRSDKEENFGHGSMRTKLIMATLSTCLCITIAGFKAGTAWSPPRPATDPAWFDSKASFYAFDFMLEIFALCALTIPRIDKRFHVPDGSTKPGDYTQRRQDKIGGVNSADRLQEECSVKTEEDSHRVISVEDEKV